MRDHDHDHHRILLVWKVWRKISRHIMVLVCNTMVNEGNVSGVLPVLNAV